jgi:hypothetical protein
MLLFSIIGRFRTLPPLPAMEAAFLTFVGTFYRQHCAIVYSLWCLTLEALQLLTAIDSFFVSLIFKPHSQKL